MDAASGAHVARRAFSFCSLVAFVGRNRKYDPNGLRRFEFGGPRFLRLKSRANIAENFLGDFAEYDGKRSCPVVSIRAEWLRFGSDRSLLITLVALNRRSDSAPARLRKDLIMPVAAEQNVSAETLRRIARDVIHLNLTDLESTSLAPVLRELLDDVEGVEPEPDDRVGPDSDPNLALDGWPRG